MLDSRGEGGRGEGGRGGRGEGLVQILAVVASIQMRTLKTEVEKGSMWTGVGHASVDQAKEAAVEEPEQRLQIALRTVSS